MKVMHILAATALGALAGSAVAGPTDLGSGPGDYTFTDNHDKGFYVTLNPGTYTVDSTVTATGFDLITVWLSYSKDHNPNSPNGNDITTFNEINALHGTEHYTPLVITQPNTEVFVDINTQLGKLTNGQYVGSYNITAVPEPASAALTFAGLGLLGFLSKRRRS